MSENIAVYKAIIGVAADLSKEGIAKDKTCTQGASYKFRGIDDIYNALAPFLAKHNLCILPRMISRECVERTSKSGGALFYTTVEAEFDFVSGEDGSKHTVKTFGEAMDSGDKGTNKAMSASYKYAAFQAFCIPTEGDNDTENTTHEVKPANNKQATKQPTQSTAITQADEEYIQRTRTALKAIFGDNKERALSKIEEMTSFIPSGKTETDRVKGVRDYTKLKGKRIEILCHNLEKMVPKPDESIVCSQCGGKDGNHSDDCPTMPF